MAQPTSTPIYRLTPEMGASEFSALPVGTVVVWHRPERQDFRAMKVHAPEPFQNSSAATGNGGVYAGTAWDAIVDWQDGISDTALEVVFQPKED